MLKTDTINSLPRIVRKSLDKFTFSNIGDYIPNYKDPKISYVLNKVPDLPHVLKNEILRKKAKKIEYTYDFDKAAKEKKRYKPALDALENHKNFSFTESNFPDTYGYGPFSAIESFCYISILLKRNEGRNNILMYDTRLEIYMPLESALSFFIKCFNVSFSIIPKTILIDKIESKNAELYNAYTTRQECEKNGFKYNGHKEYNQKIDESETNDNDQTRYKNKHNRQNIWNYDDYVHYQENFGTDTKDKFVNINEIDDTLYNEYYNINLFDWKEYFMELKLIDDEIRPTKKDDDSDIWDDESVEDINRIYNIDNYATTDNDNMNEWEFVENE